MELARQDQKTEQGKVYKFFRKDGCEPWRLVGRIKPFRISVALFSPILGGSRLLVLLDRETGEYSLPGFWSEGLTGSTPEDAALEVLKGIIPKDLSCRPLRYNGLIISTEAAEYAEREGMNYKVSSSVEMVPCRNVGVMAAKASTKDVLYDHTFVSVSSDGEVEVIFAYDLIGGDAWGRMRLSFLSADPNYEISGLTSKRLQAGLRLADTPAKGLIKKIVCSLEE